MRIKQIPEDFVVKEILDLDIGEGSYTYFLLKKRNWTTIGAINEIARRLNIPSKRLGFAGNKDKKAVTEQYISVLNVDKRRLENLKIKDIEIIVVGRGKERINLGDLRGNEFIITVRDLDKRNKGVSRVINYFDEQRFGVDKKNHLIGKAIVKKDFKEACRLLNLDVERNDYVGTLRKVDRRLLRFYVGSYQSYLWNKTVNNLDKDYDKVPTVGFLTKFRDKNVKGVIEGVLEEEGVELKDFIIRQILELSLEGGERDMSVGVKDFKTLDFSKDELNKGKFKQIIGFKLPKGSYATIVVKEIFLPKNL